MGFFKDIVRSMGGSGGGMSLPGIGGAGSGGGAGTTVNPTSTVAVAPQVSLSVPPADFSPLAAAIAQAAEMQATATVKAEELQATATVKAEERSAKAASSQTFVVAALLLFTVLFLGRR